MLICASHAVQSLQEQQRQWTIPDTLLRSNMKDAIAEDFLPSYHVRHAYFCLCVEKPCSGKKSAVVCANIE